jgi:hypothetical protein
MTSLCMHQCSLIDIHHSSPFPLGKSGHYKAISNGRSTHSPFCIMHSIMRIDPNTSISIKHSIPAMLHHQRLVGPLASGHNSALCNLLRLHSHTEGGSCIPTEKYCRGEMSSSLWWRWRGGAKRSAYCCSLQQQGMETNRTVGPATVAVDGRKPRRL